MSLRHLGATMVLACALLVSPQLTDPAAAASVDIPVHQWNMCGSMCYGGSLEPANVVIFAVTFANPRPWSVALNEVCFNSNQRTRMINALDDLGYNSLHYTAVSSVAGCGGTGFGNVVFAIGPRVANATYAFAVQDGTAERRGVVCVRNRNIGFDMTACSSHLDNSSLALAQEDGLYNIMSFTLSNQAVKMVGVDMNIRTSCDSIPSDLNKWRLNYDEIDEFCPFAATHDSGVKIDYIWQRDYFGDLTSPYAVEASPIPTGDHHYYSGRFRWST